MDTMDVDEPSPPQEPPGEPSAAALADPPPDRVNLLKGKSGTNLDFRNSKHKQQILFLVLEEIVADPSMPSPGRYFFSWFDPQLNQWHDCAGTKILLSPKRKEFWEERRAESLKPGAVPFPWDEVWRNLPPQKMCDNVKTAIKNLDRGTGVKKVPKFIGWCPALSAHQVR